MLVYRACGGGGECGAWRRAPLTRAYIEPLAVVERPPPTVVLSVWDMLAPLCAVRVVIVFSSVVDRCVRARNYCLKQLLTVSAGGSGVPVHAVSPSVRRTLLCGVLAGRLQ